MRLLQHISSLLKKKIIDTIVSIIFVKIVNVQRSDFSVFEVVLVNRQPHSNESPRACQNVTCDKPNKSGISQFHKKNTGMAVNKEYTTIDAMKVETAIKICLIESFSYRMCFIISPTADNGC